jgi:diaminohydroxyphosphoribosylaminopyrimidine deaminase/5-amino-6-(5-phosphoribosylamino)uracil reductase
VPATTDAGDRRFMGIALALARRGLGQTWPNPTVGCVVVRDNAVVGRGWTQKGGRPHAETEALKRAGDAAKDATAYVTLEPCAHHGQTPPCADALIRSGVARAVVATGDPDPRVSGQGIAMLRTAGIAVEESFRKAEADEINAGFFLRVRESRPLITLKLATTLDGRIATKSGESRWITGDAARRRGHLMRASHDAILVGSNTVAADDPELTCRLPGLAGRSPVRVIFDARLNLPPTAKLVTTARDVPTWIVIGPEAPAERRRALEDAGVVVIEQKLNAAGHTDAPAAIAELARRGITRVLCEGGSGLAASLLRSKLVDRLAWFHAPRIMGGDGLAAADALGVSALAEMPGFVRTAIETCGEDVLETYVRSAA